MKKGIVLCLLLVFTLVSLVHTISATTYQKGVSLDFPISCENVNCSSTVNVTILYPNSSKIIDNQITTAGDGYVYYTLTPDLDGTYDVYTIDSNGATFSTSFDVNYIGMNLTESLAILYVGLLSLILVAIIGLILGINALPDKNIVDEEGMLQILKIKHLKPVLWMFVYALIMAFFYITSNIAFAFSVGNELFGKFFFMLFQLMFAFAPVVIIVMIIFTIVKVYQDIAMKQLVERGGKMFGGKGV